MLGTFNEYHWSFLTCSVQISYKTITVGRSVVPYYMYIVLCFRTTHRCIRTPHYRSFTNGDKYAFLFVFTFGHNPLGLAHDASHLTSMIEASPKRTHVYLIQISISTNEIIYYHINYAVMTARQSIHNINISNCVQ